MEDDWTRVKCPKEKKRIQNRVAQRTYRELCNSWQLGDGLFLLLHPAAAPNKVAHADRRGLSKQVTA